MEGICHKEPIENNPSLDFIFNSNTYYTYQSNFPILSDMKTLKIPLTLSIMKYKAYLLKKVNSYWIKGTEK